jgi:hypothetical protein
MPLGPDHPRLRAHVPRAYYVFDPCLPPKSQARAGKWASSFAMTLHTHLSLHFLRPLRGFNVPRSLLLMLSQQPPTHGWDLGSPTPCRARVPMSRAKTGPEPVKSQLPTDRSEWSYSPMLSAQRPTLLIPNYLSGSLYMSLLPSEYPVVPGSARPLSASSPTHGLTAVINWRTAAAPAQGAHPLTAVSLLDGRRMGTWPSPHPTPHCGDKGIGRFAAARPSFLTAQPLSCNSLVLIVRHGSRSLCDIVCLTCLSASHCFMDDVPPQELPRVHTLCSRMRRT